MSVVNPYANLHFFPAKTADWMRSFLVADTLKVFFLPPHLAQCDLGAWVMAGDEKPLSIM